MNSPKPRAASLEPRSAREAEISVLVDLLAATTPDRVGVYVSAPITTGRHFSDWYSVSPRLSPEEPDYRTEHLKNVVEPNRAHARKVIAELRKRHLGEVIIDPTAVPDFIDWKQDDYRVLWARVIQRYARFVIFLDGWEYSSGCAYEFLVAVRSSLPAISEAGHSLSPKDGCYRLRTAIAAFETKGIDASFLRWVADELGTVAL